MEVIRSRKSIKDMQYYGKKRKEQKYKLINKTQNQSRTYTNNDQQNGTID